MRYALASGVRIEALDEAWAVFSPLSGETLLLNTGAAAVLERLADEPADEREVAASLASDANIDPAEVYEALRHVWNQLGGAGLIKPAE